jgi:hypothetical protein
VTIAVGVASAEGVIIGADSRQSFMYQTQLGSFVSRSSTDFAEKVALLNDAAACATFGWGGISGRMMGHHMRSFSGTLQGGEPFEDVSSKLSVYFEQLYQQALAGGAPAPPQQGFAFGFVLGGCQSDGRFALEVVTFPGPQTSGALIGTIGRPQFAWQGLTHPISRLIKGIDPRMQLGPSQLQIADQFEYRLSLGESLQEMADFAAFAMKLTIDTERFTDGIQLEPNGLDVCAEPLDIVAVDDTGASWVRRKTLSAR